MSRTIVDAADGAACGLEVHVRQRNGNVYQMARVHDENNRSAVLTACQVTGGILLRAEHQDSSTFGRADVMVPTETFAALVEEVL